MVIPSANISKADNLRNEGNYSEAFEAYLDAMDYWGSNMPLAEYLPEYYVIGCGTSAIDNYVLNGDVEGAFEFMYRHLESDDYTVSYMMEMVIKELEYSRIPPQITKSVILEKICEGIVNAEVFEADRTIMYESDYYALVRCEALLIKYFYDALPTTEEEDFIVPVAVHQKIFEVAVEFDTISGFDTAYFVKANAYLYGMNILNSYIDNGDALGLFNYAKAHPEMMEFLSEPMLERKATLKEGLGEKFDLYKGIVSILNSDEYFVIKEDGTIDRWYFNLMHYVLTALPSKYQDADSLQKFFNVNKNSSIAKHVNWNMDSVEKIWNYNVIKKILLNSDGMIYITLTGEWYLEDEMVLKFKTTFNTENDSNTNMSWDNISVPSETGDYYAIHNNILSFYENGEVLWDVFKFTFDENDFNKVTVYCFEDGSTVTLVRK